MWLLGIAARCLADQRRSAYRRSQLVTRLGAAPELRGDEHERVEAMLDAARLAPSAERALEELTEAEQAMFLLVANDELPVADAARGPGPGASRLASRRAAVRAGSRARGDRRRSRPDPSLGRRARSPARHRGRRTESFSGGARPPRRIACTAPWRLLLYEGARSSDAPLPRRSRPFIISTLPSPGILLSYAQLRRLPTDPTGLDAALNRLAARYRVNQVFPQPAYRAAIRWAMLRGLAEAPTSAALRATLYRVLAATPGIRLLGRTRDSIGRYGMAVAVDVQNVQLEMIIDPSTGALLQTSRTFLYRSRLDPGQPPGLNYRVTFLASGILKSTHARVP